MKIKANLLKKAISLIVSMALLATLCVIASSPMSTVAAASGNLIANGDAEDGTINGWNCATSGAISNINNAEEATGGVATVATAHAKLTTAGSRFFYCWNSVTITQQLSLKPNTEYVFSAFFYSAAGSTKATASILDGTTAITSYTIKDEYKWAAHSFSFTTADNGNVTLSINTGKYNYFAFDNVTLYEVGYLGAVKNGDAECGVSTGWSWTSGKNVTNTDNNAGSDVANKHKTGAFGGNKFFVCATYNTITQSITLKPNTEYILSSYVFEGNWGGSTYGYIAVKDSASTLGTKSVTSTSNDWYKWKSLSYTFTTGTDGNVTLEIYAGKGNLFAFDELGIYEIGYLGAVKNGDAEIGTTHGWSASKTDAGSFQVFSSATDTSAASVAHKENAIGGDKYFYSWGYNHLTQAVSLKANTAYMVSLDYYATNGNVSVSVNDGTSDIYTAAVAGSATNAWKSFKGYFNTNTATAYTFKLSAGWGNLYFDNVSIVEVPMNGAVTNGSFDYGTYGWNTNNGANVVTDGERNVLNVWWGKTATQTVTLKANTAYKLTFEHKWEGKDQQSDNCAVAVKATCGDAVYIDGTESAGEWKTAQYVFATEQDTEITLTFTATGGNYYITNVAVYECADMFVNSIANISNATVAGSAEESKAIRFTTAVYNTEYTINEVGVLFAAGKNIPEELTKDMLTRTSMVKGGAIDTDAVMNAGAANIYTVLVDNIDASHLDTEIAARMYLVCTDENNQEVVLYGETVVVSVN